MNGSSEGSLMGEYEKYLARFAGAHGDVQLGAFVKQGGQLIKKLRFDEFSSLFVEYSEMERTFRASMERGDTINDIVVKLLRTHSAELVLPRPV